MLTGDKVSAVKLLERNVPIVGNNIIQFMPRTELPAAADMLPGIRPVASETDNSRKKEMIKNNGQSMTMTTNGEDRVRTLTRVRQSSPHH